jgi:hypothetical protein
MFQGLKPGRLLIELGVVVLGVGIALAADSWREDRELRSRELAYLNSIAADMEEAARVLIATIEKDLENAERIKKSLSLLQSEAPLSEPEKRDWEGWTGRYNFALFAIPTGTLQALIRSGDLGLIISEDLRATLITEYAAINTYQSWIDQAFAQALPNLKDITLEIEIQKFQFGGKVVSLDSFRKSPQFVASHLTQLNLLANMLSALRSMSRAVDNIHKAVEKELTLRGG